MDKNIKEIQIKVEKEWTFEEIEQFHLDNRQVDKILLIVESRDFTTTELQWLISEIKLKEMKKNLNKYLDIIKEHEQKIINYLTINWLIDINKQDQTIKFKFKWPNLEWIDRRLLELVKIFITNKWSFKSEIKKITNNESQIYNMNFFIKKLKEIHIIKDINIEKKD